MRKQLLFIILIIIGGGLFYQKLFLPPVIPVDLTNNIAAIDCRISYSSWRYILEPFSLLSEYLLNSADWRKTLISTYLWLLLLSAIFKIKPVRATLLYLTFIALVIIFPFSCPKIYLASPGLVADFHSHTYYSHDAITSAQQNLFAHRQAGYNMFFVTEHNNVNSFLFFSKQEFPVFPGTQINTTDGISLLILSQKEFTLEELKNLSARDLIRKAHQKNMLVVLPHWWKWRKPPIEELIKDGIDGMEIYNTAYRSGGNTDILRELARKNNLFTIGSTDWHGWGSYTNVWTVIKSTDIKSIWQSKNRFSLSRIIVYNPQKEMTLYQHLIEPYFIFTDYFLRTRIENILMLSLWLILIYYLSKAKRLLFTLKLLIFGILAAILLGTGVKFLVIWLSLYPHNISLIKTAPVYFLLGLYWFFATRKLFCQVLTKP